MQFFCFSFFGNNDFEQKKIVATRHSFAIYFIFFSSVCAICHMTRMTRMIRMIRMTRAPWWDGFDTKFLLLFLCLLGTFDILPSPSQSPFKWPKVTNFSQLIINKLFEWKFRNTGGLNLLNSECENVYQNSP